MEEKKRVILILFDNCGGCRVTNMPLSKRKKEAINSEGETTILTTNTNRKTKRKEKKEGKEKNDNL